MLAKKLGKICFVFMFTVIFIVGYAFTGEGKDWPTKPIKFIVPFSAGGGTDVIARAMSPYLEKELGVPIIVENIVGGGTLIGGKYLADAKPDGYTIESMSATTRIFAPVLAGEYAEAGYGYKDFRAICSMTKASYLIVVPKDSRFNNIKEFISYAKENPKKIKYGIGGAGTAFDVNSTMLFGKDELDIELTFIPFNGSSKMLMALAGSHIDAGITTATSALGLVKEGMIRPILWTTNWVAPDYPDVPNLKDLGIDSVYEFNRQIYVPAKTPQEIVDRLEKAFMSVLTNKHFLNLMKKIGENIVVTDAKGTEEFMADRYRRMKPILLEMKEKRK
jgi:tripartite-type tricarboxylate transporter receptor subunit TctC